MNKRRNLKGEGIRLLKEAYFTQEDRLKEGKEERALKKKKTSTQLKERVQSEQSSR